MPRNSGGGFTGANAIPLGPRNPAIGAKRSFSSLPPNQPSMLNPPRQPQPPPPAPPSAPMISGNAAEALRAAQAAAASLQAKKFGSNNYPPPVAPAAPISMNNTQDERGRPRKKRSRWGDPERKTDIPGIPSSMPANLTHEQQKAYIVQLQIEDLTRKLKTGDLGIPANPEDRSPSPEPIYNNDGKRLNTREYRTRKKMEEDRHKLIQDMIRINENYKPPMDYKPPIQRISEQIMIPSDLNPSINFVGLLIGPRGNTLKKIEKESNCKIMIRGKGSVKEGKIGRKDGMPLPGEDEPLHALITGTRLEDVQKATAEINRIIKQGIEQPEGQNDLRKNQLMELARLNGTLRDDQMPREREWLRPENQNITNTTVCTKCGGRGHIAQDCMAQAPSVELQQQENANQQMSHADKAKMDSEYLSLMAELGEGPPPSSNTGNQQQNPWVASGAASKPPPLMGIGTQNFGGQNIGGNRQPWMRGGGPRGGGRGNFRGGGNRGGYNNSGQGDYQQGYNQDYSGMGGNNMGGMQMQGNNMWMGQQQQGYDGSMGWQDPSGGMGLMNPPPPPPGASSQPPPPPGSGPEETGQSGWQGQWGGPGDGSDGNQQANYAGGNQQANYAGGNQQANYAGQNMMGYGNMGWGMWGGNMAGMAQPPMPPGPGPAPPPPPGGDDNSSGKDQSGGEQQQQQWNMPYGNMGYGMGVAMGYGMPPAPPPPPPTSS